MATNRSTLRVLTEDDIIELSRNHVHEIAISDSGRKAAVVTGPGDQTWDEFCKDIMRRRLWLMDLDQPGQQLLCDQDAHSPAWSPSGDRLAYLSRASESTQIWTAKADGSEKQIITQTCDSEDNAFLSAKIIWTPDSLNLVYAVGIPEPSPEEADKTMYCNPVEVESEPDFSKPIARPSAALWSVPVFGGEPVHIAHIGRFGSLIGWTRSGNGLLISDGSSVFSIDIRTGERRCIAEQHHRLAVLDRRGCVWLVMTDESNISVGWTSIKECEIHRDFKLVYDPHIESPLALLPERRLLYLLGWTGMGRQLVEIDIASDERCILTKLEEVALDRDNNCVLLSLPPEGPLWLPVTSLDRPAEIHTTAIKTGLEQVSNLNERAKDIYLPTVRKISWESDGWEIEGLLVLPDSNPNDGPPPLILYMHGGPSSMCQSTFECLTSTCGDNTAYYWAAHGFSVLMPNYRGSRSYGKEFMKQLGHYQAFDKPFADAMSGIRVLEKQRLIDTSHMGICGDSFGAELTAWIVGHTDRFRGALAAYGRYDDRLKMRYYGSSFVGQNASCSEGVSNDDMWRRADLWPLVSPIEHAHKVTTPVLIMETSAERNPAQTARPFFNTLRACGTEAYMAYYPNAAHGGGWNEGYKRDYMRRSLAWFRYTLLGDNLPDWFTAPIWECE